MSGNTSDTLLWQATQNGDTRHEQNNIHILTPKLSPPQHHANQVPRDLLLKRLHEGLERKLTLLSAPAGFGKTTLVTAWLAEIRQRATELRPHIAWVSLDETDNDPIRFWSYVFTASQRFDQGASQSALDRLQAAHRPTQKASMNHIQEIVIAFINRLAGLQQKCVLVLEDYHTITMPLIHEMLMFLLEHLPSPLHLIIITRYDPPLPVSRLHIYGDCIELRASDLRFSIEESQNFLKKTLSANLSDTAITHLITRTEGWPAGLRMITLALQARSEQEIEQTLAIPIEGHRHILEYILDEVLRAQPEKRQEFILKTSILHRLTGSLCNAVTEQHNGEEMLEQLAQANLFLEPLDMYGNWYRYHMMFAEAMQQEARRRFGNTGLQDLYRRASTWYEAHQLFHEAIETALAARDYPGVAALIEQIIDPRKFHQELHTLRRWLEQLPITVLQNHPNLCLIQAIGMLFLSNDRRSPAVVPLLQGPLHMAEKAWRAEQNQRGLGALFSIRCLISVWQGNLSQSFSYARQAVDLLPEDETIFRGICLLPAGIGEMFEGKLNRAHQLISEARTLCEEEQSHPAIMAALLRLGDLCYHQTQLYQAQQCYQRVLAEVGYSREDLFDRGLAFLGLANLTYEWNDVKTAAYYARQALETGQQLDAEDIQTQASLLLARLQQRQGQTQQATEVLQAQLVSLKKVRHTREIYSLLIHFALANHELITAQRHLLYLKSLSLDDVSFLQQEHETLLQLRFHLAQGEPQKVLEHLPSQLCEVRTQGRRRSEISLLALMALAYQALKQPELAQKTLLQALELAYTEKLCRLFLDEGSTLATLLQTITPDPEQTTLAQYIRHLLQAYVDERLLPENYTTPTIATLLSPQELRVFGLIVDGSSNEEIAKMQVVSINTIKTQVRSIYRKLQVTDRQGARKAARMHGFPHTQATGTGTMMTIDLS